MSGHHQNLVYTLPAPGSLQSVQVYPDNAVPMRRFGVNNNVGTTFATIDDIGVNTPWFPTTASLVEVVSTSANDTAAGTGARTLRITGMDSNWDLATEDIILSGLTPAVSVKSWFRVNRAEVLTVGVYGNSNLGDITVRVVGNGTPIVRATTGNAQTFTSHFTVPVNYFGAITGANLSTDSTKLVDVKVMARDNAHHTTSVIGTFSPLQMVQYYAGVSGVHTFVYNPPIFISPNTDVYITARVASGTTSVSAEYWGWLQPL